MTENNVTHKRQDKQSERFEISTRLTYTPNNSRIAQRAKIATARGTALGRDKKRNAACKAALALNPTHIFRHKLYDIFSEMHDIRLEMRCSYGDLFVFGYIFVILHIPTDR